MISETISHYRILSQLGAGGMGEVYLAEDTRLDRKVAIKFLPPESTADDKAKSRLFREARAAAKLDHPNICSIYEVDEHHGQSFIVMQYVEGETLGARMANKPLEPEDALELAAQVADALAEAHSQGIIHRDIKPANIMIAARGQAKLMDFGLARAIQQRSLTESQTETASLLTEPGTIIGTVPYMSPEQVKGETLDARSDLFSFGCVLYEMLSGRRPFASESLGATISAILVHEPAPLARYAPDVPAELQRIVRKCLEKDREQRYQSARELLIDLRNLKRDISAGINSPEAISSRSRNSLRRYAFVGLAGLLLAAIGGTTYLLVGRDQDNAIDSLAVLPFANVGADPDSEYLSDGISESIINALSQLPKLRVLARSTVFRYKGRDVDPQEAGHNLNVRAVLTGRIQRRADTLIISTELMDVARGSQLWGEQYNRRVSDILALQEQISKEISERLRLKLSGDERKIVTKRYTENTEAYQFYLKGRFYWHKFSDEGLQKAIGYFNQAIEADPSYALAYTGLAGSYIVQGATGLAPPREVGPKAKSALEKALALDDTLAEAHQSLGAMKLLFEWDWPGAERELRRALQLNPNLADAHNLYCYYFQVIGRLDEATSEIKRAQELEPLSTVISGDLASAYYDMRQYDAAIEQYRKTSELDRDFLQPLFLLGQVYERKGMYDQAIAECQKALRIHEHDPAIISVLGYVYAVSGRKSEAQKLLNELMESWKQRYFSPIDVALVYTGLGDKDQAFAWLDRAYEARDGQLIWVNVEPELDSLRSDPRFTDLLRRIGIPR